ncbi:hypothetical protein [Rhodopirellula europaea]|nr:hypothetical protein [Rhodopirellula europaea]
MQRRQTAMEQPILVERIPDRFIRQWRNTAVFWNRLVIGGITLLWIPLGITISWLPFRNGSSSLQLAVMCTTGITLLLSWFLLMHFVARFTFNAWSQSKLPTVEIAGDRITVRWHGETIKSTVEACHFRRGRAWQMKYASRKAGGLFFGDRELILIDLPPLHRDKSGNARAYTTVAVGYTPESMAAWTDALGQGDEPSDAPGSASQTF